MWHRDQKWTDAVGKMTPWDLLHIHRFSICKKTQYMWSRKKWSTVKQGLPVILEWGSQGWGDQLWQGSWEGSVQRKLQESGDSLAGFWKINRSFPIRRDRRHNISGSKTGHLKTGVVLRIAGSLLFSHNKGRRPGERTRRAGRKESLRTPMPCHSPNLVWVHLPDYCHFPPSGSLFT